MQRRVEHELADADGCLFVVNAQEGIGPGDRFIARLLQSAPVPVVIAVNKIDRSDHAARAAALKGAEDVLPGAEAIYPVSARRGSGIRTLTDHLVSLLPAGPFYFAPEQRSDQTRAVRLAELVREQVLRRTRDEIPHSVEVQVEAIETVREDLVRVEAVVLAETESQKRILIGAGGAMIKAIGTAARVEIEGELGTRVHLELTVRVRRHWRADARVLDRLGIE
jgi:GTP-binding protein Era